MPLNLSLGALHRCLRERLDARWGMGVEIHFEERATLPAGGTDPDAESERRTFDADLTMQSGRVTVANLTAGALGADTLSIRITEAGGTARYEIGDGGFGLLTTPPTLFDLSDFERRLDAVRVEDAVIDLEVPEGPGRLVLDIEMGTDPFALLLRAFGGGETADPDLPLLSHSVVLSAASDVSLDYWWSLLGIDELEGRMGDGTALVCHVHVAISPLTGAEAASGGEDRDPSLPTLDDLDAVWELARQRRATRG